VQARVIASTLLLLTSLCHAGCGGSPSKQSSVRPTANSQAQPLTVVSVSTGLFGQAGFHCTPWLVMASDRNIYTDAEFNEMADFFAKGEFTYDKSGNTILRQPPTSLLRWESSALIVGKDPYGREGGYLWTAPYEHGCGLLLQITNTSGDTVDIPGIGLQVTRAPEPNQIQFKLPDACSIVGRDCRPLSGGRPADCSLYFTEVDLDSGALAGATMSGVPVATDLVSHRRCPPLTLSPNQSTEVWLHARSRDAFAYSVLPSINLVTAHGAKTVLVQELAGIVSFAAPPQFACYRRNGHSLDARWTGWDALEATMKSEAAYCP
jgi:hypothetical protein